MNEKGTATVVKVGSEPEAIAVNGRTGTVYVANSKDHSVSVINGNDTVVATLTTPGRPYAIAADELANKVYVSKYI